ncbi:succinylglutamate desuccinylase/aspartoacylase domain-containing protein [Halococcus saccharolyticus]|uniref:Succinylglutamate desuccinylase n=1 Tax=Halococcus saccharolyticus DSM 5350 TaxID=1227455 RepID=M0MM27_9EURY|nr:succinylglutamate desuccinylase/aspartoacylase family protein [Halococcus saccharolyticus]EMA45789.1 succinylglutamate desuccinylase [Halococcus saccharolyticus DSM 5350]
MRIEQLGDGEPEIAVVGGIHGDEPCGVRAVEHLIDTQPDVKRPVKCIVANEEALDQGTRYVDDDLNRVFPGDPDSASHERRLASRLLAELRGCRVLSMHSTQSYANPFAVVADDGLAVAESICPYLTLDAVIDAGAFTEGRLVSYAEVVEVECGYQGSEEAAANAVAICQEFLAAVGALPGGEPRTSDVPLYRLQHLIPKGPASGYEVFVTNFERVAAGEAYAAAGDETLIAEKPFYPVLMSPYGYEDEFGYAAELAGKLGGEPTRPDPEQRPSGATES